MFLIKGTCKTCISFYWNYSIVQGLSWSYGSWIYNYLCSQCLSPL